MTLEEIKRELKDTLDKENVTAEDLILKLAECIDSDHKLKGDWIPCSERLPSVDGNAYLVTDYCQLINRRRTHISYCYANKDGFWSDIPKGYEVVAWMLLPEPYRPEVDKED